MKRIIIKVGTNVLTRPDGKLDVTNISQLVDQLVALKQAGKEIILVSSGAVGAGRGLLELSAASNEIVQRQVLSAVGQVRLMELYRQLLGNHGLLGAQVLSTKEDFRDRRHFLHMRNCLEGLLREPSILPIANENDVVSITELMFTDNDELAGLIAAMLNADGLIILSSVDGLLDGPPDHPDSQLIRTVTPDDTESAQAIAPVRSSFGRGGMLTKFHLAQKTARLGTHVYIANGRRPGILAQLLAGTAAATHFVASPRPSRVKTWIAHNANAPRATVWVNSGAQAALCDSAQANSLLPVGVIRIDGSFKKGDLVRLVDERGIPFGQGMAQYDSEKAERFLGEQGKKPLVHYDYLVIT